MSLRPGDEWGSRWALRIDTAIDALKADVSELDASAQLTLLSHSLMVLKRTLPGRGSWRPSRSMRGGF